MKVLVVGSGAREHALVWRVMQSPLVAEVYCAPGNAGTGMMARNVPLKATDIDELASFALENRIDLTIVGPESALIAGIGDRFRAAGLRLFGPSAAAARIEGSKAWAKALLQENGIPCARSVSFTSPAEAIRYVESQPLPIVVKADGEALGKGVVIAASYAEAVDTIRVMMEERVFGAAGERVVIEECLRGLEVSALAFVDSTTVVPMVPACDYKRIYDGDEGPNTGGMGAYSPPGFVDEALWTRIRTEILEPTAQALVDAGCPYSGVLYAGLMLTEEGPKVLEYNARFGDPETQVILPRLKSDLVEVTLAVAEGRLAGTKVEWDERAACGVVLASAGYPGDVVKGQPIEGLGDLDDGVLVFHGGTAAGGDGSLVTAGGRVVTVVGMGEDVIEARAVAYRNVERVRFAGRQYRRDIAAREERL